jgi:hypothetical protein
MNSYFIIFIILVVLGKCVARNLGDLGGRLRPSINNYTINIYFFKKIKAQFFFLRL